MISLLSKQPTCFSPFSTRFCQTTIVLATFSPGTDSLNHTAQQRHLLSEVFFILSALLLLANTMQAADRQHVVIAIGAEGTETYGQMFDQWANQWKAAAVAGNAIVSIIGQDEGTDDLQKLQEKISAAAVLKTDEPLWLILIGHGTFDGRAARFNLRGPDLSAEVAAKLLATAQRPVAVINCSSCSAPFINALSAPNRIVVTGTKDGSEIQFARIGGYLAEAIGQLDADIDRDGQTSLLEAWLFACQRTEEFYTSDGRLATEHSLLDDSGDKKGTRAELFEGVRIKANVKNKEALDGKMARRWHLVRSESERTLTPKQRRQRDQLEEQLENLRQKRSDLSETDYLRQLEEILIPLARLYEDAAAPVNAKN